MSRLIRLYPAAWRARYEGELLDALTFRPLRMRDRLDLVRGAADARLHPELAGSPPGGPVPVGPDTGGSLPMTRSGFPLTLFLAVTAGLAFALSAMLLLVDTRFIGAKPFQDALLAIGATSLGAATWRARPERAPRWIALVVLAGVCLYLEGHGWPTPDISTVLLLIAGTLVVGAWSIAASVKARRRSMAVGGLALIVLAVILAVSFGRDYVRLLSLVLAFYALMCLRLATPELTGRRALVGILGGVLLVGLVSMWSIATSPWHTRDGYALACHPDLGDRCNTIADHVAARARAGSPNATITHIEVFGDTRATVCWTAPVEIDRGCWYTDRYDR